MVFCKVCFSILVMFLVFFRVCIKLELKVVMVDFSIFVMVFNYWIIIVECVLVLGSCCCNEDGVLFIVFVVCWIVMVVGVVF